MTSVYFSNLTVCKLYVHLYGVTQLLVAGSLLVTRWGNHTKAPTCTHACTHAHTRTRTHTHTHTHTHERMHARTQHFTIVGSHSGSLFSARAGFPTMLSHTSTATPETAEELPFYCRQWALVPPLVLGGDMHCKATCICAGSSPRLVLQVSGGQCMHNT